MHSASFYVANPVFFLIPKFPLGYEGRQSSASSISPLGLYNDGTSFFGEAEFQQPAFQSLAKRDGARRSQELGRAKDHFFTETFTFSLFSFLLGCPLPVAIKLRKLPLM